MQILKTTTYKGTCIRIDNEKRKVINNMIRLLIKEGFNEISIPIIQFQVTFKEKVGEENNNLMFKFQDRKERELCLAPEYTAVVQQLAQHDFKFQKDVKLFYVQECFRGERQQFGRWRQFTQLGVEILNPSKDYNEYLQKITWNLLDFCTNINIENITFNDSVKRGLDYYIDGKGWEFKDNKSGLQLCGAGSYDGGIGLALGIDRLMLLHI